MQISLILVVDTQWLIKYRYGLIDCYWLVNEVVTVVDNNRRQCRYFSKFQSV